MLQKNLKNSSKFLHQKQYRLEISQTLSLCSNCSCAIITQKPNENISTIKPLKYQVHDDIFYPCFLLRSCNDKIYKYSNEKTYNNIRRDFVKKMKTYCKKLKLNLKTFFSALEYFDRICSSLSNFELNILNQLSDLCLILSSKLNENINKAIEVKQYLSGSSKKNYLSDELFLLKGTRPKKSRAHPTIPIAISFGDIVIQFLLSENKYNMSSILSYTELSFFSGKSSSLNIKPHFNISINIS